MTFPTEWSSISGQRDELRRYRVLQVSTELLASIFGTGTGESFAVEAVPDLSILAVRFDHWRGLVEFLCQSATFDPIDPAVEPPYWTPSFRRVHVEAQ